MNTLRYALESRCVAATTEKYLFSLREREWISRNNEVDWFMQAQHLPQRRERYVFKNVYLNGVVAKNGGIQKLNLEYKLACPAMKNQPTSPVRTRSLSPVPPSFIQTFSPL